LMRSEAMIPVPGGGQIVEFTSKGTVVHNSVDELLAKQQQEAAAHEFSEFVPTKKTLPETCSQPASGGCCLFDFVRGNENSDLCDDRAWTNTSQLDDTMCQFAALQAGATIQNVDFIIQTDSEKSTRPIGCFMRECIHPYHGTTHWCYYHNTIQNGKRDSGHDASTISGRPICHRSRYINGTAVANADWTDNAMCHGKTEYGVINNRDACAAARECMGDCGLAANAGGEFDINDISEQMKYPPGCFVEHWNRLIGVSGRAGVPCVYWNPATYQFADNNLSPPRAATPPSDPVGWPICKVTAPEQVPPLP